MSLKYSNNNAKRPPRGKRTMRSATSQLSPAMVTELHKLVQKSLDRQAEVKRVAYQSTINIGGYNYTNFATNQVRMLTPFSSNAILLAQGVGQGDRIGNRIRVKRVTLKMTTWLQPYNAITNPAPTPEILDLRVFTMKQNPNLPSAFQLSNYFQFGDSTATPTGNILDLNYDVNQDAFTEYSRYTKKLGFAAFVASPGGIGGQGYYSNNDSEMSDIGSIDITSAFPKEIEWTDVSQVPLSRPVSFWVQCVAQDGTTNSSGTASMQMNYQVILEYTDL